MQFLKNIVKSVLYNSC